MTTEEVRHRIEELRGMTGDSEYAHLEEDALHKDVLLAIANGAAEDAAEMARLALTTSDIDFSRWYA